MAKFTMREPVVENKYHLTIPKIRKLRVGDRSKVGKPLFWRNNVIGAWCIIENAAPSSFGDETSYWIGIYDDDAKSYAGKFRFEFTTYGGMCGYTFQKFFQPKDLECEWDLLIQEKFLAKINELIDEGILVFPS